VVVSALKNAEIATSKNLIRTVVLVIIWTIYI